MRIQLSRRYQVHLAVLFGLTLVPVGIHSYAELHIDDCRSPSELIARESAPPPTAKRERWVRSLFDAKEWWEAPIAPADPAYRLDLTVVRSFNAKRLYYRPEHRLVRGGKPNAHRLDWIEVGATRLPIHRSFYARRTVTEPHRIVAYLLTYEGEPIDNGYLAQLIHAPLQLIRGSRPMTLFIVHGEANPDAVERAEARARAQLADAWRSYSEACLP